MTISTILLHAASETLDPDCGATHYALDLARSLEAHVEALVLELSIATPKGSMGRGSTTDASAHPPHRNVDVAAAVAALRVAANEKGVDVTAITERSHIHSTPEIAVDRARITDIAVAGVRSEGLLSERMVAEALVFQSGRPVIVVPDDHRSGFAAERVVVAWDYSKVAARALSDALPLLRRASRVTLVSFGDDKDFVTSLSQDEVLAAVRRRGVNASYRQMTRGGRDIGAAINAAAEELEADLLVMGGFGHSRWRDFILGGATRAMLEKPRLPSLISH